jgi:hypothetical protein
MEAAANLTAARQARLMARACPSEARSYKSHARFWIALAHRAQPPPLP